GGADVARDGLRDALASRIVRELVALATRLKGLVVAHLSRGFTNALTELADLLLLAGVAGFPTRPRGGLGGGVVVVGARIRSELVRELIQLQHGAHDRIEE